MLRICKNKKIYILDDVNPNEDFCKVDFEKINENDFFIGSLSQHVLLEEGLTVEELLGFFSSSRDFIFKYFNEYYDKFSSLISTQQVGKKYEFVRIYKKLTIDKGYMFIEPCVDLIPYKASNVHKNNRPDFLSQIPIFIDHKLQIFQDDLASDLDKLIDGFSEKEKGESQDIEIKGEFKMEITLLELAESFFHDLTNTIENGHL